MRSYGEQSIVFTITPLDKSATGTLELRLRQLLPALEFLRLAIPKPDFVTVHPSTLGRVAGVVLNNPRCELQSSEWHLLPRRL
jgi:hypothetical protein